MAAAVMNTIELVTFPDPAFGGNAVVIDDYEEYYNEMFPAGCEVPFVDYIARQLDSPPDCDFDWQKMCLNTDCELCNAVENALKCNAWKEYYNAVFPAGCELPRKLIWDDIEWLCEGMKYGGTVALDWFQMCLDADCGFCKLMEDALKYNAFEKYYTTRNPASCALPVALMDLRWTADPYECWVGAGNDKMCPDIRDCGYCLELQRVLQRNSYSAKRVDREGDGPVVSRAKRSRRNELALLLE